MLLMCTSAVWGACRHDMKGKTFRVVDQCLARRNLQPMCGTDGCSYANHDMLKCANRDDLARGMAEAEAVAFKHEGMCKDDEDDQEDEAEEETAAEDTSDRLLNSNNIVVDEFDINSNAVVVESESEEEDVGAQILFP